MTTSSPSPRTRTSPLERIETAPLFETIVTYDTHCTKLFRCVEDGQWQNAYQCVVQDKESVKIWVEHTSHGGSSRAGHGHGGGGTRKDPTNTPVLWKRLPIHEACRRQAPAWLLSCLLSMHPQSATLPTEFGQLPLHVAVECGTSPESINLLLLANWHAIDRTDNSGRTPLAIVLDQRQEQDSSSNSGGGGGGLLLLPDESQQAVQESLTRCHDTWVDLKKDHTERIQMQAAQHEQQRIHWQEQRDEEIRHEQDVQQTYKNDWNDTQQVVESLRTERTQWMEQISDQRDTEKKLLQQIQTLKQTIVSNDAQTVTLQSTIQTLEQTVESKEVAIQQEKRHTRLLELDLAQVTMDHDDQLVQGAYAQVQATHQVFLESHKYLGQLLQTQSNGLHKLLQARNIDYLLDQKAYQRQAELQQQAQKDREAAKGRQHHNSDMGPTDVANAAAAAALAALQMEDTLE